MNKIKKREKASGLLMDRLPKISVIIPVYNAERYLRECLTCVYNQTFTEAEYEVICIDDCSTDRSSLILREYENKYCNFKVIRQLENLGAGPARNAGLKIAKGEYIAFMDADDSYPAKDTLSRLYEKAHHEHASICGGGVLFYSNGKPLPGKIGSDTFSFQKDGWIHYVDYQQYYYYQRFIFERKMLVENDIWFPDYLRFQDPPFFVKAMVTAKRFYALKDFSYVYRNEASHVKWTAQKINDMLQGNLDVLELCVKNRLNILYRTIIKRVTDKSYLRSIIERSFIDGNDEVLDFYRKLYSQIDFDLLGNPSDIDTRYIEIMAKAQIKRNMRFNRKETDIDKREDKKQKYKVSVIIPVYNTKDYLRMCIDSILRQTLEDIEILCIDDGSTDGSDQILEKYSRKNPNLTVYHKENGGLSSARNMGIQFASGKYIYYMDSDDVLSYTALEELYSRAEKNSLDVLFFSGKSFFEEETDIQATNSKYYLSAYKRKGVYPDILTGKEMFIEQTHNKDYYTSVCIQFFRTDFIRENHLVFYDGILHEDNLYSLMAIMVAERTQCIQDVLFYRRVRNNSIMTNEINYRNIQGFLLTAIECIKFFHNAKMSAEERETLVHRIRTIFNAHVIPKWLRLHDADKVLLSASLTSEDRMFFDTCITPMITMFMQNQGTPNKVVEQLKTQIAVLKKTTVPKTSKSYKIGRFITFIPRQTRNTVRALREHGIRYTIGKIKNKLFKYVS